MKTDKEISTEALRRASVNRKEKNARKQGLYTVLSIAASLVVIVGFAMLLPHFPDAIVSETTDTTSAVMLANSNTGGYVLIGLLGLILGAATTLFITRRKK